jgi:hypothetical protein
VGRYDDIINLSRPESSHPRRPISARAAQFASFKSLQGYEDDIKEQGRYVDKKIEISESKKESLDNIISKIDLSSKLRVKYFKKDLYKDGGKYLYKVGLIKKIDEINKKIIFDDKEEINLNDIIDISIYKEI